MCSCHAMRLKSLQPFARRHCCVLTIFMPDRETSNRSLVNLNCYGGRKIEITTIGQHDICPTRHLANNTIRLAAASFLSSKLRPAVNVIRLFWRI